MATRSRSSGKKTNNSRSKTLAERADRYVLYEKSVQAPDVDVEFALDVWKREFGGRPTRLREDFCGTAAVCREWVKAHRTHRAWGVDLDPEPLAWGRKKNIAPLTAAQQKRVTLVQGDVRDTVTPPVDIVMAQNFSYFLFEERRTLLGYFRAARRHLDERGMIILDAYGGPDAIREALEETEYSKYVYVWDQHSFDPITRHACCFIHFAFPDGSRLDRAFRYDWRMWTIPELREVLADAGFTSSEVWWEGTDPKTGEGTGDYAPQETADADEAWVAYIVAFKR